MHLTPIGIGAWAMGGGGWAFAWGPQDDNESIAAIHAALDTGINWIDTAAVYGLGHSEEVVARALKGRSQQAVRLHQVRTRLERARRNREEPEGGFHPPRSRSQPAPSAVGCHRSLPDPLARAGRGHRGRVDGHGAASARGQSALDRRLQFQRGPNAARPGHRSHYVAAATLFHARARNRRRDSAIHAGKRHRRDRVFAHEIGPAVGRNDARAHRRYAGRRFAPPYARISRSRA